MAVGGLLLPITCALSSARGPRWSSLSVDVVHGRRLPAAVMASHLAAPRKAAAALDCSQFSCTFNHTQHCYTYMTNSYQSIRLLSTTSNLSKELTFETVLSKENRLRCVETMAKISYPRVATKPTTVKLAPDTKADTKKHVTDSPSKPRKQSSILVPMCHVSGEICLLYTVRSKKLRSHKGEVSFPGGMEDPCDEGNPVQTAVREAYEEVGLDPSLVDVWGQVPPIPSNLGDIQITGVLAYIGEINPEELQLNSQEVSEAFVISLKHLCDPEYFRQTQFRSVHMLGGGYTIPVFLGGPYKVWGVTAIFTHMAMRALLPGLYKHNLKHIPPL